MPRTNGLPTKQEIADKIRALADGPVGKIPIEDNAHTMECNNCIDVLSAESIVVLGKTVLLVTIKRYQSFLNFTSARITRGAAIIETYVLKPKGLGFFRTERKANRASKTGFRLYTTSAHSFKTPELAKSWLWADDTFVQTYGRGRNQYPKIGCGWGKEVR